MACRAFARVAMLSALALAAVACTRGEPSSSSLQGAGAPSAPPSASSGPPSPQGVAAPLSTPQGVDATAPAPTTLGSSSDPAASSASAASASALLEPRSADASATFCRAVRGPVALPIRGAAALVARGDRVDAVLDDDGRPRVVTFAAAPAASSGPLAAPEPADAGAPNGLWMPCATAGEVAFCPDRSGAIHRASLTGEGDRIVASGRTGTRVAAGTLAGGHAALAYLASRKTTEGWVSEAWLAVDDEAPVRLSEDGSGATAVDLASRGGSLVALSVDARAALTALHARPVTYDGGVRLGEDAVVFVGGPGDRRTAASLILPPAGPGLALLPIAKDMGDFGLAVVRLDDPPRVDEPVIWSMYPNGLDPAPVAAASGGGRTWIARVRPQAADPTAPHVLELCEAAADGALTPRDVIPTAASPGDVSLALGPHGELWLAWVDAAGSWLERLTCR
jgi:hypothetical protein